MGNGNPRAPSAHENCITAVSSRGPPQLLQPAEGQSRHFRVFSWLPNQAPFLPHSCRHTDTGALSPCVTCAAVPHQGHSAKAHSRSRVCDNSKVFVKAGLCPGASGPRRSRVGILWYTSKNNSSCYSKREAKMTPVNP